MQIRNLSVVIDIDNLLPQKHPYVITNNTVQKIFGNKFTVVVGLTAKEGTIFQAPLLEKVKTITEKLKDVPGVVPNNITSLASKKIKSIQGNEEGMTVTRILDQVPDTPEKMEAMKKAIDADPVFENLLVSKDRKTTQIVFEIQRIPGGITPTIEAVKKIIEPEEDAAVDISLGGGSVFLSLAEKFSSRVKFLFPLALLIIGLIHYEAFRTWQALFLPLVTSILAVIWALGGLALTGQSMDVFNSSTPILILAVAAGHAVQILKRYYEEFANISENESHLSPKEKSKKAVVASLTKMGPVMIVACTIAALGFLSLIIFEIKTIRTFGLFTAGGIISALILEMTFIPAFRTILPPPGEHECRREKNRSFWDAIIEKFFTWSLYERKKVYAMTGLFVALIGLGGYWLKVENSQRVYFDKNHPARLDDAKLNAELGGTSSLFLLIEGNEPDAIKDPSVLKGMEKIHQFLSKDAIVGKSISIVDFVKKMNQSMNAGNPSFYTIPDSKELIGQYLFMYSNSGEPGDFDNYVDNDYQKALVQVFLKVDSSIAISKLLEQLKEFAPQQFGPEIKVSLGGGTPGGVAMNEVMIHEKILNILQIMGAVFLISSLVFRSFLAGLLILTPLIAAVLVNFGVMGLFGIPLQLGTALVAAMAVGIGADYSIYLSFRLREELSKGGSEDQAISKAYLSAGKAVLFVSSAVGGGFGVLMFSHGFLVHIWMGFLIMIATLVSSISALTLFPALIFSLRPKYIFSAKPLPMMPKEIRRISVFIILAFGLMTAPKTFAQTALSAEQIMKNNFMTSKVSDSDSQTVFQLVTKDGQTKTRISRGLAKMIPNSTDYMRLVIFESPPDIKGTKTLMIEHSKGDDDIWVYLPALKKVRRLITSNKKDSFAGTDYSYGDMLGHKVEDWKPKLLREEKVEDKDCYVIENTPKNKSVVESSGYSKRLLWIDKQSFVVMKSENYDGSGKLFKKFSTKDIQKVDEKNNKWQAMTWEALNVQTGHKTIIQHKKFRANVGVPDTLFTARSLEKK